MTTRTWIRWPITAALALTVVLPAGNVAHAQSAPEVERRALVIRDSALVIAGQGGTLLADQNTSAHASKACNRGRRALIGGAIGGAAAYPLARLAYLRFANEAAGDTGSALAALVMGGSIAIGALVGRYSCK
jgi:hypothetical protein